MLRASLCVHPNPFWLLSNDPYEAVWRMAALCTGVLALVTIAVLSRTGWTRLTGFGLAATLAAGVLAALAGRQATIGLACAGVPGAGPAASQAAEASATTLAVFQVVTVAACLVTLVLLIGGARRLVSQCRGI